MFNIILVSAILLGLSAIFFFFPSSSQTIKGCVFKKGSRVVQTKSVSKGFFRDFFFKAQTDPSSEIYVNSKKVEHKSGEKVFVKIYSKGKEEPLIFENPTSLKIVGDCSRVSVSAANLTIEGTVETVNAESSNMNIIGQFD